MYKPINQKLNEYYEKYLTQDVCFTPAIIQKVGLVPNKIHFKCKGEIFPCILYSSSLSGARVIAQLNELSFRTINDSGKKGTLFFTFQQTDNKKPFTFFTDIKINSFSSYKNEKPDYYFIIMDYSKRPPDDLIELLGNLLDKETKEEKRQEQRILLNEETQEKLHLNSSDCFLFCSGKAKKCMLLEISATCAKLLLCGTESEYQSKKVMLLIKDQSMNHLGEILGTVVRCEAIPEEKGSLSIVIELDRDWVPPSYLHWLDTYLLARNNNS